jgi:hydrogenase maturation protein HypF
MVCARREILVTGVVQGVGFRPWVARAARALGLKGSVRNTGDGVRISVEGALAALDMLVARLRDSPPAAARIETLRVDASLYRGEAEFRVVPGDAAVSGPRTRIPPDAPLCGACQRELFDPGSRRFRYAFGHCAVCGPRASVLLELPWDRERMTLAAFPPCDACRREYEDPADRRFHAESIACPACGPRVRARRPDGGDVSGDPIEAAAEQLAAGGIVAVKGYGGYHLATLATSEEAVARLRKRKGRPTKPLAVLVPDLATARRLAVLDAETEALLAGPTRAVVVAPRRWRECARLGLAAGVAPGTNDLGLVLPCAPLHFLLLFGPGTRPGSGHARLPALVFTSANLSGEPTLFDDAAALARLGGIADILLQHDRAVAAPCDDPVFRSSARGPIPLRLARATAPCVLALPRSAAGAHPAVILAVGGDLKSAPALVVHGEVVLGAHIGDLATEDAADALEARTLSLARQHGVSPGTIAHDLHPGYASTAIAQRLAEQLGTRTFAVQHHHAHAVACLVEHGHPGPALALTLDGAGWGPDGTFWGGELLRVSLVGFERLAHIDPVPLPGGDAAAREPWRMAAVWLARAFPDGDAPRLPWHARREDVALAVIARMAERGVNAPLTTSCGRLFDAVASLLDLADRVTHEGEAALALEALAAAAHGPIHGLNEAAAVGEATMSVLDLVREVALAHARGEAPAPIARRFHRRLAARLAEAAARHAARRALRDVALTGGCFQNRLLLADACAALEARGLRPLVHSRVPPNDGGLAVGQAAIAAAQVHYCAGGSKTCSQSRSPASLPARHWKLRTGDL